MAVIKCKMCGGDLALTEGQSVAECEYCGSRQTVPAADNERKLTLFARANRLRFACEFDKAAGIYESIVADFQEEAEAYWGLVLCKYGIEYVDDPATGKKIPTCHRSSFESVMENGNFEQALENADAPARKVYREEAKQLEEIRKGIISVSANEEPYDIFICYKETDEQGDRTLDSVLAQDLYDALTEKEYRVFFARITLEEKLGQEYEPYIFAALNSAKVMLAVGTDYEYYNAVWVKNEWSRYLKLMEKDKSKYLIPCFKGIDAYDMPKEFAKLQAQDLGKLGAVQDLLRGVEKLIPRQSKQESNTIVLQQSLGNNAMALLKRGNMALEDEDWKKADEFFEEVLNQDAECAEAYIGKALAAERCGNLSKLVQKRLEAVQNARAETLTIAEARERIAEALNRYPLEGYLKKEEIEKLYRFDRGYPSTVPLREQQRKAVESYWDTHKQLSRAVKFASGETAQQLTQAKQMLLAGLNRRITEAKAEANAEKAKVEEAYAAHLDAADEQAAQMGRKAAEARERDYQEHLEVANRNVTVYAEARSNKAYLEALGGAAEFFEAQGAYQDAEALTKQCREKIAQITAEQSRLAKEAAEKKAAEEERMRQLVEQAEREQQRKNKIIAIIVTACAVLALAVYLVVTEVILPPKNYEKAVQMLENGQYAEAVEAFEKLGDYEDSLIKYEEASNHRAYELALEKLETGDYLGASEDFAKLGDFQDSQTYMVEAENRFDYQNALDMLEQGNYQEAYSLFATLGDFQDAEEHLDRFVKRFAARNTIFYGSDNSRLNTNYTYDSLGKVIYLERKNDTVAYDYYDSGVLKQMEINNGSDFRSLHQFNESGHPVYFGYYNFKKQDYVQYWRLEYSYDENGNVQKITGLYTWDGEEGLEERWSVDLAPGDVIEIEAFQDGSKDLLNQAVLQKKFSILRADGKTREEYNFLTGWVNHYVYQLDEHGNATSYVYCYFNGEAGYKLGVPNTSELVYQLSYNEKDQLVEQSFNNYEGKNVRTFTYDEDGNLVNVEWSVDGLLSRNDKFSYEYVYQAPADKMNDLEAINQAQPGDSVFFGFYEQDADDVNGKEKIEWVVLDRDGDKLFVMSRYALDSQTYHNTEEEATWETCALRQWLNNYFLYNAFTASEIEMIPLTTVVNSPNPAHDTDSGNDTQDRVYLLSTSEVEEYLTDPELRICVDTQYAAGEWSPSESSWWLRTTGSRPDLAEFVTSNGNVHGGGEGIELANYGIRPVMWIDLSSVD